MVGYGFLVVYGRRIPGVMWRSSGLTQCLGSTLPEFVVARTLEQLRRGKFVMQRKGNEPCQVCSSLRRDDPKMVIK